MNPGTLEQTATLWLANGVPARMVYAGRRWRITDTPTRITEPVWALPLEGPRHMTSWRLSAEDDAGRSFIFDVYREGEDDWHVYACRV